MSIENLICSIYVNSLLINLLSTDFEEGRKLNDVARQKLKHLASMIINLDAFNNLTNKGNSQFPLLVLVIKLFLRARIRTFHIVEFCDYKNLREI